ncbi:hypothetical protein ACHHV8_30345 [Paenibacillus sp. TAB 01]|uniref:hypothetical protein n=1 Tax=Paenibacillus sp. TAB 01 TaxID=3368988 RepID=UPI0037514261
MWSSGYIFAYTASAIFIVAYILSPKHLNKREVYVSWYMMTALTLNIDLICGLIYDRYDFVTSEVSLPDLLLQALLAPSASILVLNFMPAKTGRFILYLIGVTLLSLLIEWLSLWFGYLVYKGWKLWYSAPFYFFGVIYLRWHLRFLRKNKS